MFCVTHQGLTGTLENKAPILTGTGLRLVPTDESKVVGLLDTLREIRRQIRINHSGPYFSIFALMSLDIHH